MKVIAQYPELNKKQVYRMTEDETYSVKDAVGRILEVTAYVLYNTTNSKNEEVEVLSFETPEGVFSTTSPFFIEKFLKMVEAFMDEGFKLEITSGQSKSGRTYYSCKLID